MIDDGSFNAPIDEQSSNPLDIFKPRNTSYVIKKGDKLAQLVIVPIWTPELKEVEEFSSESERGEQGFGSTGF